MKAIVVINPETYNVKPVTCVKCRVDKKRVSLTVFEIGLGLTLLLQCIRNPPGSADCERCMSMGLRCAAGQFKISRRVDLEFTTYERDYIK
jgi:hypothetical protein